MSGPTADPEATTDLLLGWLREAGLAGSTILDIGCGSGELLVQALEAGAISGTGADLSAEAIAMAGDLAHEAGVRDRLDLWVGDAAVEPLDAHDVVVLNRVICCYPDADALVTRSTAAARHLYAFALPESRGAWGLVARVREAVYGAFDRLQGDAAPHFVHDREAVDARVRAAGFRPIHTGRHSVWYLALYERA